MNKLYEALETCLQQLEQGADVDSVLFAYPDLADELRPILKASLHAKTMTASAPSADLMRRGKARLLQRAADMREAKAAPPRARKTWLFAFRPVAVALAVIFMLFASGTGLVRAASTTLPGDGLYPVKRTWENVNLWLAFNPQQRITLGSEYEQERLDEVEELFSAGRSVTVVFAGRVTERTDTLWMVAGIPVAISSRTNLPDEPVTLNDAVRVTGRTRADGTVEAERLELLPQGAILPISEMEKTESETHGPSIPETHETPEPQEEQNSGSGSGNEAETPESGDSSKSKFIDGKVESFQGNIWIVNGQLVDVSQAEIKGAPTVGADAKVEGYVTADGRFVATKIEFKDGSGSDSNDSGGSDSGSDGSGGSGSNHNGDGNGNGSGGDDNGNSGSGGGGGGGGGGNDNGNGGNGN